MLVLVGLAILALMVASAVVGVRMLLLWRRSRQKPELYLGLMMMLLAVLGYPLLIASRAEDALGFAVAWPLSVLAGLCANAGFVLLYSFTWKTFRPKASWAAWLTIAIALGYVGTLTMTSMTTFAAGTLQVESAPFWRKLFPMIASTGAYGWAAFESIHYFTRLKRQLAVGIGDPVVCNRLLLWGMMSSIACTGVGINNIASLFGVNVLASIPLLLLTAGVGLAQAVFLWLTFLPPQSYTQWVATRHATAGA